jgi:arylsulfatase A-like enzyme
MDLGPGRRDKVRRKSPFFLPNVVAVVFTFALSVLGLSRCTALAEETPSVILIIIDTVRADHLGCYGYERETSPNLDAFAEECILFEKALSPAPWTTPAIASMFTGQFPRVLGYDDEAVVVDEKALCLAEVFKRNGYATAGAIAHIFVSAELGFGQGFDSLDEENAQGHGHISSPSLTDKGIAFVDAHKDERFFLFLHYFDPHCDYILHEPYDFYPDYDGRLHSGQPIEDLRKAAQAMTAEDRRYLNALYDSEIRFMDEHIGRFFRHLKDIGIYEDLVIVVASDHGEAFLERDDQWIGHTKNVYQELVHVPFMIMLPGDNKARRVAEWVSLVDFMPTVVAAAGLEVPGGYRHDARDLLASGSGEGREVVFSETGRWGDQQTLIRGNWKMLNDRYLRRFLLFDLDSDPGELHDLSGERDDVLRQMRAKLLELDYDLDMGRSRFRITTPKLSPEDIEKLKSLGYIR